MKTATRWTAITLTAVFLMTSGLFALTAGADDDLLDPETMQRLYTRWQEGASEEQIEAMGTIEDGTLSVVAFSVGTRWDKVFLEAVYRKVNVARDGFTAEEEEGLAALAKLSVAQIDALYSVWRFMYKETVIGQETAKNAGETLSTAEIAALITDDMLTALVSSPTMNVTGEAGEQAADAAQEDTQSVQDGAQSADDDLLDPENMQRLYTRWQEGASEEQIQALGTIEDDTLSAVAFSVGTRWNEVFMEAVYRKGNTAREGFSAEEEEGLAALAKLSMKQIVALYSVWCFMYKETAIGQEPAKNTAETLSTAEAPVPISYDMLAGLCESLMPDGPAAGETQDKAAALIPAVPAEGPLTDEKAKEVGDYVMSRIGQGSEQEQQDLGAWFMALSVEGQNSVIDHLNETRNDSEFETFWSWMIEVFTSSCSANSSPPDTLNLRGEDWNALTIPGLPAPAQGKLQKTAEVDNKRAGRQVVLGQVTQDTFDAWLTQIPQGGALTEKPDADGKAFDSNFGPSFSSELQDSGGKAVTVYYQDAGGTDVRVDYLCTDQTLSVTVLKP